MDGFDVVTLKLNGTFGRDLELLDPSGNLYVTRFQIQTALWKDSTGEQHYISIFPNFIRKFTRPCLLLLEYISCNTRKGEDIFSHIDDRDNIHYCEDRMAHILEMLDKKFAAEDYTNILNSLYKIAFNRHITISTEELSYKRFPHVFILIIMVQEYFGVSSGGLAAAWFILQF